VTPSQETTVYGPGEMAENDWSPYRIAFTHAPPPVSGKLSPQLKAKSPQGATSRQRREDLFRKH
jgi:hypothetical protein